MHGWIVGSPGSHDGKIAGPQFVGSLRKARVLVGFASEEFNLSDSLKIIHQECIEGAASLATNPVATGGSRGVGDRTADEQGNGSHSDAGEKRIVEKEEHCHPNESDDRNNTLFCAVDQEPFHGTNVLNDPGHQIARSAVIKPSGTKALEFRIKFAANIEDDILFKMIIEQDTKGVEEIAGEEGEKKCGDGRGETVGTICGDDIIQDNTSKFRIGECGKLTE